MTDEVVYRRGRIDDLVVVVAFVDYWLAGRGRKDKAPGVSNDYFVSAKQHYDYLKNYQVMLAVIGTEIVGWSVKNRNNVMIHLLVAGTHRGRGIGKELVLLSAPEMIRSKMDQSTGNPEDFYLKLGFVKGLGPAIGKNRNIELFVKSSQS